MRIIVDEMPKLPKQCKLAYKWDDSGTVWCIKNNARCSDTAECPYFISLGKALEIARKEMASK